MNIGLVLSGGMAKGAYQIGALRALNNFVPLSEIKYISCASVGVLNGYAYATENLDRAEHMWKNICTNDTRFVITQILRSSMLQQNIKKLYDPKRTLSSTFYCSLLDLSHRNIVYKDLSAVESNKIPLYLKASVAMPVYNRAVQLDNTSYFDGAMIDNIPVYPLLKHSFDYIICVYFDDTCYKFENTFFDNKVIKITFPCESMLKQSVVFKKEAIDDMIKSGYDRTTHILKKVFAEGYENVDHIYRVIEHMNQKNKGNNLRITGDVLVTNLNKITQRLTKRKIL
jgi:predicted acylesterase/phospholipase RssA